MMMLKIFTFYFSVSMSESIWIAVDVFITVFLTWAVSQSKAASRLAPQRPTAKLLGPQTLASGIGLVAINWIFLSSAYVLLFKQGKKKKLMLFVLNLLLCTHRLVSLQRI